MDQHRFRELSLERIAMLQEIVDHHEKTGEIGKAFVEECRREIARRQAQLRQADENLIRMMTS